MPGRLLLLGCHPANVSVPGARVTAGQSGLGMGPGAVAVQGQGGGFNAAALAEGCRVRSLV
jgi:hypothetical protein